MRERDTRDRDTHEIERHTRYRGTEEQIKVLIKRYMVQ